MCLSAVDEFVKNFIRDCCIHVACFNVEIKWVNTEYYYPLLGKFSSSYLRKMCLDLTAVLILFSA